MPSRPRPSPRTKAPVPPLAPSAPRAHLGLLIGGKKLAPFQLFSSQGDPARSRGAQGSSEQPSAKRAEGMNGARGISDAGDAPSPAPLRGTASIPLVPTEEAARSVPQPEGFPTFKPAVFDHCLNLLTNERQPQSNTNEYPVRVALVGSPHSGRKEFFRCLSRYQASQTSSRNSEAVVSGPVDEKVIRTELLDVKKRNMTRVDWRAQQASAAVFVYNPLVPESVEYLENNIDTVICAMNEEIEKVRGYYTDSVNSQLGQYNPTGALTVADFKRISVPVPFVPHVLVLALCPQFPELSNGAQTQAQEISAKVRNMAFEKGLRWTSINHPPDDSSARTLLCLARGVVEDCDLIGIEEWNKLVQDRDDHGARCTVM